MINDIYDTYIPPNYKKDIVIQKLKRLPVITLCKLIVEWISRFPLKHGRVNSHNIKDHLEILLKTKIGRPELAKLITLKYWNYGLNMYQLAQLDTMILLQHPKSYLWNSHRIYRTETDRFPALIIPNDFTRVLQELFQRQNQKCHIFYYRHPNLPLNMFRISLFELSRGDQHYIERTPFYVVFTVSKSPIIIHTHYRESDTYAKLIMQLIKESIMITSRVQSNSITSMNDTKDSAYITLKDEGSNPIKNLSNIYLTSGIDGTGNTVASWQSYSNGSSDVSPLSHPSKHQSIKGKEAITKFDDKLERKRKSMLRFHGKELDGEPVYDNDIPVEKIKFTIENHIDEEDPLATPIQINFSFTGKDVFGGIHELCDEGVIDIDKIPGWLCGDNGTKSGNVIDGDFEEYKKRGGLI
ncbi:hypothetical protein C6P45_000120 [Maudiozyma exigua]|uniref:Uncharacterized protein n=1 Tax=Maudiozyma exigua TaxID=34358 RepID=A0A9P6WDX4_MAUEX|nr:hypothetical protein C6P45_000120 [Kazachstania exigua]